jgi:hypothetical protein
MPDPGSKAVLLLAALAASGAGLGWLALAMDVHWAQVRGTTGRSPGQIRALRGLGALSLLLSLALCLRADHATIGALLWVMTLAAGALAVAFTLAWQPRALALLVAWLR